MKKFTSIILAVIMLAVVLPLGAMAAGSEEVAAAITGTGTCHVEMTRRVYTFIDFTPSADGDYTFISDLSEDTPHAARLAAVLYCGKAEIASDSLHSAGNGNFCFSCGLEADKTYRLRVQLQNADSGSADISALKEVTPKNVTNITGDCIISKPGSYTCEQFIVNNNSTLIIGRNAAVKVTDYYSDFGKVELRGRLDLSQTPFYTIKGDTNIAENGTLIEPNTDSDSFDVSQFKEVIPEFGIKITGNCVINKPGNYECSDLSVSENSTLIIGRNVTIKVKADFTNKGKIELYGNLDYGQVPSFAYSKGNINIAENGTLIEPKEEYFDYYGYHFGSVLSDGSLWIILVVAVVVVAVVTVIVIVKKKKKNN